MTQPVPSRMTDVDADGRDLLDDLPPLDREALRWSVRAADGLDGAARAELNAWLARSPLNRDAFAEWGGVWDALEAVPPAGRARWRSAVAIGRAAESSAQPIATGTAPVAAAGRPVTRRVASGALAAVVAAMVLGGSWAGWARWQQAPVFAQHVETRRGEQLDVVLPDGSRLRLDTATSVDVTLYRGRRTVRLAEGQAVFEVAPDTARPFEVLAGASRITVVGTRFSVRHLPSSGQAGVAVGVIEGRVRVARADGTAADAVLLAGGQGVQADAVGRPGLVAAVDPAAIAPWRERRLDFHQAPLSEVLAEVARYGVGDIRLASADVGRLRVTASVDLAHVADFLKGLPLALPVRVERQGAAAVIVATGASPR